MEWKKKIRTEMRAAGHQPSSIDRATKDKIGSIYHGGCRRCEQRVAISTSPNLPQSTSVGYTNVKLKKFNMSMPELCG